MAEGVKCSRAAILKWVAFGWADEKLG
jgi:hypothetical protein